MRIEANNIVRIEEEYLSSFKFKTNINSVEFCGLQYILLQLLDEYNMEQLGQYDKGACFEVIERYTTHRGDCLDVLDGVRDILFISGYAISSMYLTENGIVVMECVETDDDYMPIEDSTYYASLN